MRILLLAIGLVALSSCRKDTPPPVEICIGDGVGGADCIEKDGSRRYRRPSELENYWMTNQEDQAAFASWCYKANPQSVERAMDRIAGDLK